MEELTIKYNTILIWTTKPVLRVDIKLRFIIIIESCINKLCIDVWFVRIGSYLAHNYMKIWNLRVPKNRNIEKNL